jgi:hypothetical protein
MRYIVDPPRIPLKKGDFERLYFITELSAISCHAFKLGMGSEQDAKPAAWLRLTHYKDESHC